MERSFDVNLNREYVVSEKMTTPAWEQEFRDLVLSAIKEQVARNTGDLSFLLMWARRPSDFVEIEAKKLTEESWVLFPTWCSAYDAIKRETPIAQAWQTMSASAKKELANQFKILFYERRGLYRRK